VLHRLSCFALKYRNIDRKLVILYFSILLHCIAQWVLQVMFLSACSFIVFSFSLSFTICFGLHGHDQVCRIFHIFIFICLKDSASRQTHARKQQK
jgi:hypothetical protein